MFWVIGILAALLAHTAPFPFVLDVTDRTVWRMPATEPPTIYLTFDDGPNPAATPQLLDVLQDHKVPATFFVIDRHITNDTVPILRRTFEDGHAVALHSHARTLMFESPAAVATTLEAAAARIERLTGHRPCHAFRPTRRKQERDDVERRRSRELHRRGLGVDALGLQLVPRKDAGRARAEAREPRIGGRHHRHPRRPP